MYVSGSSSNIMYAKIYILSIFPYFKLNTSHLDSIDIKDVEVKKKKAILCRYYLYHIFYDSFSTSTNFARKTQRAARKGAAKDRFLAAASKTNPFWLKTPADYYRDLAGNEKGVVTVEELCDILKYKFMIIWVCTIANIRYFVFRSRARDLWSRTLQVTCTVLCALLPRFVLSRFVCCVCAHLEIVLLIYSPHLPSLLVLDIKMKNCYSLQR